MHKIATITKHVRIKLHTYFIVSFAFLFVFSAQLVYAGSAKQKVVSLLKSNASGIGGAALFAIIPGAFLLISGGLFDQTIDLLVANVSSILGDAQSGGLLMAIEIIWTVIRDITNILIIGTFVYVAIIKIITGCI